jgi:nucleoside-diphosphate-sugar epimerase
MSNILITGVAGFIGCRTAKILLERNKSVIGIDNINDYYDRSLKNSRIRSLTEHKKFHFYKRDIENKVELKDIFEKWDFDAIINLAARAGVGYSIENPNIYMATNAVGTLNLLESMKTYNIKKIVLASTSSLYAGQEMPFSEDLPVNTPISPYAATKKAAEVMAYTYHYLYGLDVSIVRYFTVYGPAGRPDMSYFRFIQRIMSDKPIQLNGDGSQKRDFTYIDDIAEGTIHALKHVGYEIINLGGGKTPISLNYMIRKIEDNIGKKADIQHLPFKKEDMKETWADIGKAKRFLGWEPKVNFDEGLKKTVQWHKENWEWLKKIRL